METVTLILCTGTVSNCSKRVTRTAGGGGVTLSTGRSLSFTTAAGATLIFVEREMCRAAFDRGKYWPFLATVERPATERKSSKTRAVLANIPGEKSRRND
jgi:hypothetical protein